MRFSLISRAKDSGKIRMLDGDSCRILSGAPQKPPAQSAAYRIREIGDTTLLGFSCRRYRLTRKGETVEAILAPELGELERLLRRFQEASPQAGRPLASALAGKGFPLAYTVDRRDGAASASVAHVRRGTLSPGRLAPAPCSGR
jgi:hypothetical protein